MPNSGVLAGCLREPLDEFGRRDLFPVGDREYLEIARRIGMNQPAQDERRQILHGQKRALIADRGKGQRQSQIRSTCQGANCPWAHALGSLVTEIFLG